MDTQQYRRCFLRLILNGIAEQSLPQCELSRADYERLSNYITLTPLEKAKFAARRCPTFLWIETVDGIHLLVSEQDIELLRLFTQSSPTPPPEPPPQPAEPDIEEDAEDDASDYDEAARRGRVELYFRGRPEPIVTSTMDEPEEITQYFPLMDDSDALEIYLEEDGEFIFFTDDDGEEVGVRLDQLVLLVAYPGSLDFGFMEEE